MTPLPLDELRTALVAERERVVHAIEYLHEENQGSLEDDTGKIAPGVDNHPADAATETVDRELDYTLEENAEHVLTAIDAALKRMEDGAYGLCQNCGQPISPERLEAMPWATHCIDCKRKEERG